MISSVRLTALLERRTSVGRCTAAALGIYIPAIVLGRARDVIEKGTYLVRCMSPEMARNGQAVLVASCLLLGDQRT
jgi:hypothetical protein